MSNKASFIKAIPLLFSFTTLFLALTQAISLSPSPKASTSLICHTNHASECYPSIFQPSHKFEIVHDDQSIPAGLHIRMNLATGVKEAKINVPDNDDSQGEIGISAYGNSYDKDEPEERETGMYGGPSEIALVVEEDDDGLNPATPPETGMHDQSISPSYSPPRPPPFDPAESSLFAQSVSQLNSANPSDDQTLLPALSNLEDLSHSHLWGTTLTRSPDSTHKLFQLVSGSTSISDKTRSAAALLLGTAIHNNPDALVLALSHFYNDQWPTGPLEAVIVALAHEHLPVLLQRMVFLLSALCQDQAQLSKFVNARGLELLLDLFDAEHAGKDGKERLRGKISNFVLDHFLNMDLVTETSETGKVHKEKRVNLEVETELDGEDSWVIPNPNGEEQIQSSQSHQVAGQMSTPKNIKLWCSAFTKSLGIYSGGKSEQPGAVRAIESIREAQAALNRKLQVYGCSCDQDCKSYSG